MTDTFDTWKFPETLEEESTDALVTFPETLDEDQGDYATFPWQFEQTFETAGPESINATQTTVNSTQKVSTVAEIATATQINAGSTLNATTLTESATSTQISAGSSTTSPSIAEFATSTPISAGSTTNPAATAYDELITSTQISAGSTTNTTTSILTEIVEATSPATIVTSNPGAVSASLATTTVSTAGTINTVAPLDESIASNSFQADGIATQGSTSELSIGATSALSQASTNGAVASDDNKATASQPTVSASQNDASVGTYGITASSVSAVSTVGVAGTAYDLILTASQVATTASMLDPVPLFEVGTGASQPTVTASQNDGYARTPARAGFGETTSGALTSNGGTAALAGSGTTASLSGSKHTDEDALSGSPNSATLGHD